MSAFPFFPSNRRPHKAKSSPRKKNLALRVEALEDRSLPSGNTISGFVFHDANNNGLREPGESPIANNPVELHNSSGAVVAHTTTDATGLYQFSTDSSVDQTPRTLTKTVTFAPTQTNFNLQGLLDQFDPALGTLQEVDLTHAGSITSEIKVENTSTSSGSLINGTVSGDLTLTAPGVNDKLSLSQYAGSFNAQAFDGNINFQNASGTSFGQKTANGSNSIVLTGSQVTPFIGTGKVQVSEAAQASSHADGGGNVIVNVQSTAQATITVTYKYVASNALQPGDYTIVETQEPPGYFPGKNSSNGTVLSTPSGTEVIPVHFTGTDAPNNDFGKLKASSIAGFVYFDANDNGTMDNGEAPIAGVTVTLTGTDASGAAVQKTATTAADGSYKFDTLKQGNYTVTETQPSGYLDGKEHLGSAGGTLGTNTISNISLPQATDATDYDFGEVKGGSLAGFVYLDSNDDGLRGPGETGIAGSKLTLTGTDDNGNAVSQQATTDQNGAYQFNGLRPGNYTITQDEPDGYIDGKDTAGTLGGTVGHDVISAILLGMGQAGENYNFGEKLPPNADLGIVKTASASVSGYGDHLTYTLQVTNNGPLDAQNVVVTDTLPPGVTYVSGSGNGWTVTQSGGVITATRPALPVGQAPPLTVTVIVPSSSATLTNDAKVTSDTPDRNPNNNDSKVTTTVQGPTPTVTSESIQPLTVHLMGGAAMADISKNQLMTTDGTPFLDPNVVGQMAFVDGVFQTLTGNSASVTTNLLSTQGLLTGSTTRASVIANAWNTDAHRALVAEQLYGTYLGRSPTAAEESTVMQALAGGATVQSQVLSLLTSQAYQQLHPTASQMAAALSQAILGQTGGDAQQGLLQAMDAQPLSALVNSLLASPAAASQSVDRVFTQTLRRHATAAELAQWAPAIQSGSVTTDQLTQQLLATDEFFQLALNSVH
jgi:uncharacterized repeat protein (TIGR01451 family)